MTFLRQAYDHCKFHRPLMNSILKGRQVHIKNTVVLPGFGCLSSGRCVAAYVDNCDSICDNLIAFL